MKTWRFLYQINPNSENKHFLIEAETKRDAQNLGLEKIGEKPLWYRVVLIPD